MRWQTIVASGVVALALAAAGCGGTSDSSTSSSTPTNASAAGLWSGTDSASGLGLEAFIDSSGSADFIRADGVQYTGSVQVSGSTLVVSLEGYTDFGDEFSGGSTYGIGTFNGTVSTTTSIGGTLTFTPTNGTQFTSTWSLTYDSNSLYTSGSSLSAIAGTYTGAAASTDSSDPINGSTVTISSSGALSGSGSSSGCVLSGALTIDNSSYDIYSVAYSYSGCTGDYESLNAVQFTGMAVYNTDVTPAQVVIGATASVTTSSTTTYYGLVSSLTAS
jgi:hypothetical protein